MDTPDLSCVQNHAGGLFEHLPKLPLQAGDVVDAKFGPRTRALPRFARALTGRRAAGLTTESVSCMAFSFTCTASGAADCGLKARRDRGR